MPSWTCEQAQQTVAALLKAQTGEPWSTVKRHIALGRVFVDGERTQQVDARLNVGQVVELRVNAPRPHDPMREAEVIFDDAHVIVINKPSGISSVPYDARETGTAMDLIRAAWRRQGIAATQIPLHVVHRIDKGTSGLIMFAKTKPAEIALAAQLRAHTCERQYVCLAHGQVAAQRIESMLVTDRGDGIRGSTRFANQGKRAVTHVAIRERLPKATLCEIRLETGKTHQIRIHLAEAGHPLVGEDVYDRDFFARGGKKLTSARLMLHAETLGFAHPKTGEPMRFQLAPPTEFEAVVARLRSPNAVVEPA